MAFKFKMQKALEYREQLEEEAKTRLAHAERELLKSREALQQATKLLTDAEAEAHSDKPRQAADFWLQEQYLKGLRADLKNAVMREKICAQTAEEARSYLAARSIDRKLLEKLKEKQKKQFVRLEQMQEQHFNDEIATLRYKAPTL